MSNVKDGRSHPPKIAFWEFRNVCLGEKKIPPHQLPHVRKQDAMSSSVYRRHGCCGTLFRCWFKHTCVHITYYQLCVVETKVPRIMTRRNACGLLILKKKMHLLHTPPKLVIHSKKWSFFLHVVMYNVPSGIINSLVVRFCHHLTVSHYRTLEIINYRPYWYII